MTRSVAVLISLSFLASASPFCNSPSLIKRAVTPQVNGTPQWIANVTDPAVTRDSCGSVRIGSRLLWTCRDTEPYYNDTGHLPLITNTASWSNLNFDGTPAITAGPSGAASNGTNPLLQQYGGDPTALPAFFSVLDDECPQSGACDDGSRYAIWPDSPPMVTSDDTASNGSATAYTWIVKAHLQGLSLLENEPAHTLYKVTYTSTSDQNTLPSVSVVDENFWGEGEIGYGRYGNVISNGTAYLYGQTDMDRGTTLAKVPVGSVEDKTQYQYYVSGAWTDTQPGINDTDAIVANAGAGGQGTFYYSPYFASYIWIGQAAGQNVANFYITTAPAPEGPWVEPYMIYAGKNGDNGIAGGYSLQANPGMGQGADGKSIYLTWTQQFDGATYGAYVTPLVLLQFQ